MPGKQTLLGAARAMPSLGICTQRSITSSAPMAANLAADTRRRTLQLPGDLAQRQLRTQAARDLLALCQTQYSGTAPLRHRRKPAARLQNPLDCRLRSPDRAADQSIRLASRMSCPNQPMLSLRQLLTHHLAPPLERMVLH